MTEQGTSAVQGVELAWSSTGKGEPFVLVHGWTGSSATWDGVRPALSTRHRVVTFDHRGHGGSTNTGDADTYCFDQLVVDFTSFVDDIGLDRFHLLGHSMGGLVAMRYAIGHRDRVQSLVLMDTGAGSTTDSESVMEPLCQLVLAGGIQAYVDAALPYVAPPGPEGEERRRSFAAELARVDPVAFVALARELTTYPSCLASLATLPMPTSVLVGVDDVNLRGPADDLAATIPGAVLTVIPDAAHMPHHENPVAWLAAIDAHFDRLPGPGGTDR